MNGFDAIQSSLSANQAFLDVTTNNLINKETTRTEDGGPYQRQAVSFESKTEFSEFLNEEIGRGVEVSDLVMDDGVIEEYKPDHPDANEDGIVLKPNINMVAEMTNLVQAQRGYEAGATALEALKDANDASQRIGR